MNTHQLLSASVLDIIFEGRNKEYGAYILRKEYNARLKKSMIITGMAVGLLTVLLSFKNFHGTTIPIDAFPDSVTLVILPPPEPPLIIPKIPAAPAPIFKTVRFTSSPVIVKDKDVSRDEMPQ